MDKGYYRGIYTGKELIGLKNGHDYQFKLDYNGRSYSLHAYNDLTDENNQKEVDLYINYASENSIRRNWDIK